jgi:hypothetical protein
MPASAQFVVQDTEYLREERPEAWAMHYFTASSLMTGFGPVPALAPGHWQAAVELGEVPHLDATQRVVGFNGTKAEDLNKSPVVGRLRGWIGLPGGFVAELGWTPPVTFDGARPRDLFAAAVGRRVVDAHGYTVSLRAFGQHGAVTGGRDLPGRSGGRAGLRRQPLWMRRAFQRHPPRQLLRTRIDLRVFGHRVDLARDRWRGANGKRSAGRRADVRLP